ncbi:MAG: hemolysin III family protein [bacterium]
MFSATEISPISGLPYRAELVSGLFQAAMLLLCIGGVAVLVTFSGVFGSAWHVVSFSIYGASLILLYGFSALYHTARHPGRKHIYKVLDHSGIFIAIAGTYTPLTLVTLNGGWGWSLFGVVWALALTGIVWKAFFVDRYPVGFIAIYLAMGWIGLIAAVPLLDALPAGGLAWLGIGGLVYTLGTLFFVWESLPYHHVLWHLFVLGGVTCHTFSVLFYVLPQSA